MPASCPHCSAEITSLTGFVPQEKMQERLNAKTAENNALKAQIEKNAAAVNGYEATVAELTKLKAEVEGARAREGRVAALRASGLDEGLLDHVALLFDSAAASEEGLDFATWLAEDGAARSHPLLAPHFRAPADAAGATGAAAGAGQGKTAGAFGSAAAAGQQAAAAQRTGAAGATPAGPTKGRTPEQLAAYFASPAYKALPSAEKTAMIAKLKAETEGGGGSSI
jgi:hypothetical protein